MSRRKTNQASCSEAALGFGVQMFRKSWLRYGLSAMTLVALASCSALPGRDLRNNYVKMVGKQGLTAVYPPREEFQVGDIFIRSYNTKKLQDLEQRAVIWLGSVQAVRDQANHYLNSRINFENTVTAGSGTDTEAKLDQSDFSSNNVTTNNASRRSLPIVAFPVITGSAASAGSLGGFGYLNSFGVGFGTAESVSLDFTDTRVHGVPFGAATTAGKIEREYLDKVCGVVPGGRKQIEIGFQRLELAVGRLKNVDLASMCSGDRKCDVAIITRTYLTRKLKFNYTSARIANLAASQRLSLPPEAPTTVAVPGNLNVDIALNPANDGAQVEALLNGIAKSVESGGGQNSESIGLSFLGFQGNSLAFQRNFLKPVAIAYDSINFDLNGSEGVCHFDPSKKTK